MPSFEATLGDVEGGSFTVTLPAIDQSSGVKIGPQLDMGLWLIASLA